MFNFSTLKSKSFYIGLLQILVGIVMLKVNVMPDAGATLIGTGAATIGLRDAVSKAIPPVPKK